MAMTGKAQLAQSNALTVAAYGVPGRLVTWLVGAGTGSGDQDACGSDPGVARVAG